MSAPRGSPRHPRTATMLRGLAAAASAATLLAMALPGSTPAGAATTGHPGGACRNGFVGLTYDDGPNPASTTQLLSELRAGHARATFFIWGQHAMQNPGLLRDEARAGMWIGNHTFTHPNLPQIGEPAAYEEIASTQTTIFQILHRMPTLFREPFGAVSDSERTDQASLGLLEVLWTVDSRDWAGASVDDIVAAADTLQPGGIILMHDGGIQNTVDALPIILSHLAARGLCPGKIVYTPQDISGVGTVFHAIAVSPFARDARPPHRA